MKERRKLIMNTLERARAFLKARNLNPVSFQIGHLSDDLAMLYSRDLYLIGYIEESEILAGNDITRYTAVLDVNSGKACGVFFDIPNAPEFQAGFNAGNRKVTTEVSN